MPYSCSHGYYNGGGLIRVVRRIVADASACGADIATYQAYVVGIDQTEQTLSRKSQANLQIVKVNREKRTLINCGAALSE